MVDGKADSSWAQPTRNDKSMNLFLSCEVCKRLQVWNFKVWIG
jgi:hypothetical protein